MPRLSVVAPSLYLATVESRAGTVSFVYGRYEQGELSGWSHGTALPAESWGRSAVHVPGRWGSLGRPGWGRT
jgi:hypothetical protein